MKSNDLSKADSAELLSLYAHILNELRRRNVLRSTNNPVADYSELLVSRALDLTVARKSNSGYDAKDSRGNRYQIKGRRITSHNKSRQLSFIRGLEEKKRPFDYLAGVLFNEDFSVFRGCVVPFGIVREHAKYVKRVNGWRFLLPDSVWSLPKVRDITSAIRAAV